MTRSSGRNWFAAATAGPLAAATLTPAPASAADAPYHVLVFSRTAGFPRATAHVLASLNESSYSGGSMSGEHPITWCKTIDNGRSFHTGSVHQGEAWSSTSGVQDAATTLHLAFRGGSGALLDVDEFTLYTT